MGSIRVLEKRKLQLKKSIRAEGEIIKGSLVEGKRVCGKPNCRCTRGKKHTGLYLSQYIKGKPHMTYIPKKMEKRVRTCVENYRRAKESMNKLSAVNLELLKRGR